VTLSDPRAALRTYDVASRKEWLAIGLSARQLRELEQAGQLVRIRYGAYATSRAVGEAQDPADKHVLVAGAAVVCQEEPHVISHESAAIIHHLDLLREPDVVTLTREPGPGVSNQRRNGLIIRTAATPAAHTALVGRTPVTTPARTVADLARILPFMDAVVVADSAIRRRKTNKQAVRDVLAGTRQPGKNAAEQVIEFSTGIAESVLESCARVVFHEAGLPAPRLQFEFHDHQTLEMARVDFYWPEYDTIVEADGMSKYERSPNMMRRQFQRDRMLRDLGHKVVHFTWRELFESPAMVIHRIRKAFAASSPW
jgi:very-short-patch-repair endonuclease